LIKHKFRLNILFGGAPTSAPYDSS